MIEDANRKRVLAERGSQEFSGEEMRVLDQRSNRSERADLRSWGGRGDGGSLC